MRRRLLGLSGWFLAMRAATGGESAASVCYLYPSDAVHGLVAGQVETATASPGSSRHYDRRRPGRQRRLPQTQDALALLAGLPLTEDEAGYVESASAANMLRAYRRLPDRPGPPRLQGRHHEHEPPPVRDLESPTGYAAHARF